MDCREDCVFLETWVIGGSTQRYRSCAMLMGTGKGDSHHNMCPPRQTMSYTTAIYLGREKPKVDPQLHLENSCYSWVVLMTKSKITVYGSKFTLRYLLSKRDLRRNNYS